MKTFCRAKRDSARDTQFVFQVVVFFVVLCGGAVLLGIGSPFSFGSGSAAASVSAGSDLHGFSAFVVGSIGLVLGIGIIAQARSLARGRSVLIIEVGEKELTWGFGDRLQAIAIAEIEELRWDSSYGLMLEVVTREQVIQLPNLGSVLPSKDREELRAFLRAHHPTLRTSVAEVPGTA